VTVALAELPDGALEIAGYMSPRFYGNVPPRQVLKKVLGTPALVVNDNGIIRYCQGPGVAGPRQRPHYLALRSAQNAAGEQPYV
jgi:hypothetical protein